MKKSYMWLLLALGAVSVVAVNASEEANDHDVDVQATITSSDELPSSDELEASVSQEEESLEIDDVPSTVSRHSSLNTPEESLMEKPMALDDATEASFAGLSIEGNTEDSAADVSFSSLNVEGNSEDADTSFSEEENKEYPEVLEQPDASVSDTLEPPLSFHEAPQLSID